VVASAGELFAKNGYAGTTLSQIAAKADVSVETVQLHGPKAALLRAAFEVAGLGVEGVDDALSLSELQAILQRVPGEMPEALGQYLAAVHDRTARLAQAAAVGAAQDPTLAAYWNDMLAGARRQAHSFLAALERRGLVGDQLPRDEIPDTMLLITGPEIYVRLVDDLGWTKNQYADWLARMFRHLVLNRQ